jgi:hypothetical protein
MIFWLKPSHATVPLSSFFGEDKIRMSFKAVLEGYAPIFCAVIPRMSPECSKFLLEFCQKLSQIHQKWNFFVGTEFLCQKTASRDFS